jgi:hypothetical protein
MSQAKKKATPAISKVSDLATSGWQGRDRGADAPSSKSVLAESPKGISRALPPPSAMGLKGGETVKLREEQVFWDKVAIREGEVGKALYPSSQAAAWVVHFPRVGPKLRVIPEHLLGVVE